MRGGSTVPVLLYLLHALLAVSDRRRVRTGAMAVNARSVLSNVRS